MHQKIKKSLKIVVLSILLFSGAIVFEEEQKICKHRLWCAISGQYQEHKALIEPYFDQQFYLSKYGEAVKKSGLAPIDHFLQCGWYSKDWRKHTDPNAWFNLTLYQDRLWGEPENFWQISDHPFVTFLKQSKLGHHPQTVEIYAMANELGRVWLAVEGFLRLDKFNINLHLPPNLADDELMLFTPQSKRGVKVLHDNHTNISFYDNDFIKHPGKYALTNLTPQAKITIEAPITYVKHDFAYLMHRLYNYTGWFQVGRINPMMVNIAHNCDEPLVYTRFGHRILLFRKFLSNLIRADWQEKWHYPRLTPQDFKDYMVRIGEGFDLCLISTKLPLQNLKVIPGYLFNCIEQTELAKSKKFEVSYLLSLAMASFDSYRKRPELNYVLRKEVWDSEKDFTVPTKFYLSYRDKDKFPKELQHRAMPTDSKKWIYDSEFSIAVENARQEDWFSEKLIGCFMSLTVPIYVGCPNITDYFDPRGMIIAYSLPELIKVANAITPQNYQEMLPYLRENQKRAIKLLTLEKEAIAEFFRKHRKAEIAALL